MTMIGYTIGAVLAVYIFVPLFYPLRLVSVNEYLLLRFESRMVHIIGSVLTVAASINFAGVVLYGASAAIEAMSGFSAVWAIILSGVICAIYTTIGGIRAVIWNDAFQSIIIISGVLYATIGGIATSAGFSNVIKVSKKWDRFDFLDFDPDPTKRLNFYGCVFGMAFTVTGIFGYIQACFQRYSSLPTITQARWSVIATIPGHIIINSLSCLSGLVLFSYYTDTGCDPLKAGYIPSPNHILPYFMATVIGTPVLTGLFLSCLISSALSTASSSLNSSAANIWEDVLKFWYTDIEDRKKALRLKLLVAALGVLAILDALAITFFKGIVTQILMTVSACLQGPAAALFYMGAFVPWVNWKGASIGAVSGFIFGLWMVIGSFYSSNQWQPMPTTTADCTAEVIFSNMTAAVTYMPFTTSTLEHLVDMVPSGVVVTGLAQLYNVSFMWKREVVTAFTVGVALLVSLVTGNRKIASVPPRYVHPIIRRFVGRDVPEEDPVKDNPECEEQVALALLS